MAMPLKDLVGQVVEISPKYKAIVEFTLRNKPERALLWFEKLKENGQPVSEGGSIDAYLELGCLVKFSCHSFDESGVDKCRWFITSAQRESAEVMNMSNNNTVLHGLYNCSGRVQELKSRQGVLTYSNNGKGENVMFLASKFFISGKRVSAKACLNKLQDLKKGQMLYFDAVPCDPTDNSRNCSWFATVVWKGRRPVMEYDDNRSTCKNEAKLPKLTEIKLIISNPHMKFLRCEGQVMEIVNEEYGIALGAVKPNCWESVLFHRSVATLFDLSLAKEDLTKVYKKGDRLRILAAASSNFGTRWVASQIRILVEPSISHLFQF